MKRFIQNWYLETEIRTQGNNDDLGVKEDAKQQADDLIKRVRDSTSLTAMAVNPLLLTMIATVHRRGSALPGRRVELYKEIFQVLLEKRQRAKKPTRFIHSVTKAVCSLFAHSITEAVCTARLSLAFDAAENTPVSSFRG